MQYMGMFSKGYLRFFALLLLNLIKCKFRAARVDVSMSVYSLFGDDLEFAFLCADFGRRIFLFLS